MATREPVDRSSESERASERVNLPHAASYVTSRQEVNPHNMRRSKLTVTVTAARRPWTTTDE
jgi:hypothetical protein